MVKRHRAIAIVSVITRSIENPNHLVFGFLWEKLAVKEYFIITSKAEEPKISGLIISGANGPSLGIIQYVGYELRVQKKTDFV